MTLWIPAPGKQCTHQVKVRLANGCFCVPQEEVTTHHHHPSLLGSNGPRSWWLSLPHHWTGFILIQCKGFILGLYIESCKSRRESLPRGDTGLVTLQLFCPPLLWPQLLSRQPCCCSCHMPHDKARDASLVWSESWSCCQPCHIHWLESLPPSPPLSWPLHALNWIKSTGIPMVHIWTRVGCEFNMPDLNYTGYLGSWAYKNGVLRFTLTLVRVTWIKQLLLPGQCRGFLKITVGPQLCCL